MLLNLDPVLTGQLLLALDEMGHGNAVVIADAHFTAAAPRPDLGRAFDALPKTQRQVLWLTVVEGMDYEQVAAVLGTPVGTVRSRLSRAREALRTSVWAQQKTKSGKE